MARIRWEGIGCLLCGVAIALGAFGAHLLKAHLSQAELNTFETAVRYQMYHGLGLVALGCSFPGSTSKWVALAGSSFTIGTLLFSGSLYLLVSGCPSWLGAITPLGGVLFICAWIFFANCPGLRKPPR